MADIAKLVEEIKSMSVLEVSELVKALEDTFGVSAAAPIAVAAAPAAGTAAAAEEEKSEFTVELTEIGANKIAVIKVVREITGLGLGEAKALVEAAPKAVKENVPTAEAKEIEAKLKEAGATVKLK